MALYLLVLNSFIILPNILEGASKEAISFAENAVVHKVSSVSYTCAIKKYFVHKLTARNVQLVLHLEIQRVI